MQSMGKGRTRFFAFVWLAGALVLGSHIATRNSISIPAAVREQAQWRDNLLSLLANGYQTNQEGPGGGLSLLLGGSNILYGISAEDLFAKTGESFYSLGLFGEGYSFDQYLHFLDRALRNVQATDVDLVIYSTIDFYRSDNSFSRVGAYDEVGVAIDEGNYSLLPSTPLFTRIQNHYSSMTDSYDLSGVRGDMDLRNVNCSAQVSIPKENYRSGFEIEFGRVLSDRAASLQERFPLAKIIVTVPARYVTARQLSAAEKETYSSILVKQGAELLVEPPLSEIRDLCNAVHHPSETGRTKRTNALATLMRERGLLS